MDFINTLIGGLLLILGCLLFVYNKGTYKKDDKDPIMKSFYIEIFFGIIVLVVCGLGIIIRELNKLF